MSSNFRGNLYNNAPVTQPAAGGVNPPPPPPLVYNTGQVPQQNYVYQQQPYTDSSTLNTFRKAIPVLPMCLAVTYCIINCIIPGIGTILAAFSLFCCGDIDRSSSGKVGTFCINFWSGIGQLLLIPFGFGFVWSVFWGMAFIAVTTEAKKNKEAISSHPTTTVTQQNFSGITTVPTTY